MRKNLRLLFFLGVDLAFFKKSRARHHSCILSKQSIGPWQSAKAAAEFEQKLELTQFSCQFQKFGHETLSIFPFLPYFRSPVSILVVLVLHVVVVDAVVLVQRELWQWRAADAEEGQGGRVPLRRVRGRHGAGHQVQRGSMPRARRRWAFLMQP